jgi:tRNA/rRNA methyltransferase
MECAFILVEPAVPENIGAAARALKVMGFSDLRLVNPSGHLSDKARWLAHASGDVLESAGVYASMEDAVADLDLVIGTTAKKRSVKYDYYRPEEIRAIIGEKKGAVHKTGVVFGREESGLTNAELQRCDLLSTIPIAKPYPSLNLAQSVMLYAYILSELEWPPETTPEDPGLQQLLKERADRLFREIGIAENPNLYNRMMERLMAAGTDDIHLFLSFYSKLSEKMEGGDNKE